MKNRLAYRLGWLLGKGVALGTVLMLCSLMAGCGGGSVGSTGIVNSYDVAGSVATQGWNNLNNGKYGSAIGNFEAVIDGSSTAEQKQEAYIGKGYAVVKRDGIRNSGEFFEKAINHPDAKVGMAGYYLSVGGSTNINKGIGLLESLQLSNVDKAYTPQYNTGITNAEAHALLGILYYMAQRTVEAREQLFKADELGQPGNLVSTEAIATITGELLE